MPTTEEDPFKNDPRRWVGRSVTFDLPSPEDGEGKRVTGTVISQTWVGRTQRGAIPDYSLVIEGRSGRRITVSLVESHATFNL